MNATLKKLPDIILESISILQQNLYNKIPKDYPTLQRLFPFHLYYSKSTGTYLFRYGIYYIQFLASLNSRLIFMKAGLNYLNSPVKKYIIYIDDILCIFKIAKEEELNAISYTPELLDVYTQESVSTNISCGSDLSTPSNQEVICKKEFKVDTVKF